ncbi:MAG TPA: lantibiotic dehydratase [Candidatus Limnocylindrales bacterium]|nr:lantibiotic dehydratase [Candidatus Limnocylindrales bacterium]
MGTGLTSRPGWTLLPSLLLRRAGFPLSRLTSLADAGLSASLEELVQVTAQWEAARAEALTDVIAKEVVAARHSPDAKARLSALSKFRGALGRRRVRELPPGTSRRLCELAQRMRQASERITQLTVEIGSLAPPARRQEAQRLRAMLGDPLVRQALIQLSPAFADHTRTLPDSLDAALTRRAYLFAQRLAAKNETTSFFGPLTHGRVDPAATGITTGHAQPSHTLPRAAFLSFWAAVALGQSVAADLAEGIPVRRNPAVGFDGRAVTLPNGRSATLTPLDRELIAAADSGRGIKGVADQVGAKAAQRLERLTATGVLLTGLEPASTRLRPLDELRDWVRANALDSPWPAALDQIAAQVDQYARATGEVGRRDVLARLENRFTELTGVPARRAAGQMYADRHVVYEECQGDGGITIGGDVAARWEKALTPYLDWCAELGRRRQDAIRALAARVIGTEEIPFLAFAQRLTDAVQAGQLAEFSEPVRRLEQAWDRLVEGGTGDGVAVIAPESLAVPTGGARFVSPDLLLGSDGMLVVGELHPYVYAWGSQALFAPDPAGLQSDFTKDLSPWGGAQRMATVVRRRRHKGIVSDAFPGRFIEVTGVATADRQRCLAAADLVVRCEKGGPALCDPHSGPLTLYAGEDDHPHLLAFAAGPVVAPRFRRGDRAPRVMVGDVVVQRARWWLDAMALRELVQARDAAARLAAVATLRARQAIPRWVFVKSPRETKPICLDLSSAVAVEILAGHISLAGPRLLTEEMCPAPEHVWLHRDVAGETGKYTSELRVAMIRRS